MSSELPCSSIAVPALSLSGKPSSVSPNLFGLGSFPGAEWEGDPSRTTNQNPNGGQSVPVLSVCFAWSWSNHASTQQSKCIILPPVCMPLLIPPICNFTQSPIGHLRP
ncbi:hypothetical protein AVEN_255012-1 [Araneus ventricosus]|uniref:Uncharacterized protein n=1 Tax=Araneus ventricosus TaxID=182803 RepID=A0A4Y2TRN2_ARAVE|nr:hypothetical protein AVEN_255012-1 [Araneus ventricosus]